MRYQKYPSLFFWSVAIYCFVYPQHGTAQHTSDSTRYYYDHVLQPRNQEDLPQGIRFFTQQKEQKLAAQDTLGLLNALRMVAIAEYKIGSLYDSERSCVEALHFINASLHKDTLINARLGIYNQLGIIYRELKNYDKAIEVFDVALGISKKTKDSITVLNNKANIYKDAKDYEQALIQYEFIYGMANPKNDSVQWAMLLDNLGSVQSKLGLPGALDNLEAALAIRLAENDPIRIYTSHKNLTQYYADHNDIAKAHQFAERAYAVVRPLNNGLYTQEALSLFMALDSDPKVLDYQRLTDSLSFAKLGIENKNAFMKYNLEEERKRTETNKLLQEKEKRTRLTYQYISWTILILLVASYFIFRYRYKKGKIEAMYKTETRISKKIHDEVANDIYRVMAMVQQHGAGKETVLDGLDKIYTKTRDISKEHSAVLVKGDFSEILTDLLLGYKSEAVVVVTKNLSKIDWDSVSEDKKTTIYRVLQELMTNMRKHSKATSVALAFERTPKKLIIDYSDNGVGCDLVKRNGLQNAENRTASLKGSISFESSMNHGFKAKITI